MFSLSYSVLQSTLVTRFGQLIFNRSLVTARGPRVVPNLVMTKLETPAFKELFTPEFVKLSELFNKYNYELRIAGGAVRDLILGKVPHDVDFASTATPTEMKSMFEKEEIRMINAKGEKHGTITCRINDKENFEVTTLRIDVVTDGRHAEVEFTRDWKLDSLRRDLTINSMFLGLDGTIYDYFNGKEDLAEKKIRFVGSPVDRIQEDYLRILRYFRFFGRIAVEPNSHEPDTLMAIRENANGLARISGERLWVEMKKIVVGNHADSLMRVMCECGVLKYVGLNHECNTEEFSKRWLLCKDLDPMPMTMLSSMLENEDQVIKLNERLKMSREEVRLALFIINHREDVIGEDKMRYCQDLLCDTIGKERRTKEKICELLKYIGEKELLLDFGKWDLPKFPVNGIALLEAGVPKGPKLAKMIDALRQKWKESRYTFTEKDLMGFVPEILETLD